MKLDLISRIIIPLLLSICHNGCENSPPYEWTTFPSYDQNNKQPVRDIIYFISNRSKSYQLYSMQEDGTNIIQLTNDSSFEITHAALSLDGRYFVVTSPNGGNFYGPAMYVMTISGRERTLLSVPSANNGFNNSGLHPVWSPDGRHIAFTRYLPPEVAGIYHVFSIDRNGSDERQVSSQELPEFVNDWDRSGRYLLASIETSATDSSGRFYRYFKIGTIDSSGNHIWTWGQPTYDCFYPVFSSDGTMISYTTNRLGSTDLFIIEGYGGKDALLTDDRSYLSYQSVAWAADDSKILANAKSSESRSRGNYGNILLIGVADHKILDITPYKNDTTYSYAVGWYGQLSKNRNQR